MTSLFVKITAAKQGALKGESTRKGFTDKIPGIAFTYDVTVPRDAGSGSATGKPQHSAVTFTKAWGAASPQIFQACTSSEALTTVVFDFLRPSTNGVEEVFQTITLTDAVIVSVRRQLDGKGEVGRDLEDVSFIFAGIEMADRVGGTTSSVRGNV